MIYAIQHPITGKLLYPPNGRHWTYGQDQMLSIMKEWADYELTPIDDYERRVDICGQRDTVPQKIAAIMLSESIEKVSSKAIARYEQGRWPLLYFTNKGRGGIACKRYLENMGGRIVTNLWPYNDVGHTDEAAKLLKAIFDGTLPFETPKPTRLIERILQITGDKETLILDSFAGSGTTAHAVLNMNNADGGNRKFILVEMMDYAASLTAERVKRVIDGYGEGKKAVEGTGGNFSYYELGPVLLLPDGNLNEEVGAQKIREYVYYMETKESLPTAQSEDESYFMGLCRNTAYYFYYERESVTTLDYTFLTTIQTKAEGYTIYADLCAIPQETLRKHNITFKKIPRDIARL